MNIRELLQKAYESQELIGIHKWDDDPTIFLVGRVKALHDDLFVVGLVDTDGSFDEFTHFDYDEIVGLDFDTHYLGSLEQGTRIEAWNHPKEGKKITKRRAIKEIKDHVGRLVKLKLKADTREELYEIVRVENGWFEGVLYFDRVAEAGAHFYRLDSIEYMRVDDQDIAMAEAYRAQQRVN